VSILDFFLLDFLECARCLAIDHVDVHITGLLDLYYVAATLYSARLYMQSNHAGRLTCSAPAAATLHEARYSRTYQRR
jgi:hypothetical protein